MVRKAETSRSESGQTSVETVLIIGAIALTCLVAMIFLRGGISNVFDSIVDPNKYIAKGFPPNVMPENFKSLPKDQLDSLVEYLVASSKGA